MGTRKNRLGEAVLTSAHNLCFEQKYGNSRVFFFISKCSFFGCKIFNIFELASFRNGFSSDDDDFAYIVLKLYIYIYIYEDS